MDEALSCVVGLTVAIGGGNWEVTVFCAVVFAVDGGLETPGPKATDERLIGPTAAGAEAGGPTIGLPIDFKGIPGGVAPPFPSLGIITIEVAGVGDRDIWLPVSPLLV